MRSLVFLVFLTILGCGSGVASEFEILIWADEPINDEEYASDDVVEGPCGIMRVMQVNSLDELSEPEYGGLERVLEFNEVGEIVGEWRMPVESFVIEIGGHWLTVTSAGGLIALDHSGQIRLNSGASAKETSQEPVGCPSAVRDEFSGDWGESAYLRCWSLPDQKSGEARLLAYQGVCT